MSDSQAPDDAAMAEVDAKFAAVAQRRRQEAELREENRVAYRDLWMSHHWPHRYERCTVIRGRHVCRRCLWFYALSFLTLAAAPLGISPWPSAWDAVLVWVLSIPATIDFVAGELGWIKYDARRQVVVTSLLGLAVGRGFYAELVMSPSPIFWGPVAVFGSIWFAVAVRAWFKGRGQYREDPHPHAAELTTDDGATKNRAA